MKIIGIDPGKTIGLCLFRQENFVRGIEVFSIEEVISCIKNIEPDYVVLEDFIVSPRPSEANIPIEQIGVLKYWCRKHKLNLKLQSPSAQKWGRVKWPNPHPSPHVSSAIHHVMYFNQRRSPKNATS